MPRDDDSLTGHLGRGRRRKLRNLKSLIATGGSASTGGEVGDDGGGEDGGGGGGTDTGGGGSGECEGGLLGCKELAAAEVCLASGSGAAEKQVGCVLDVIDAELQEGDTVAWAADVKCETANEVSADGMLKMTDSGLLVRDALDTLDDITVEAGTVEVVNGKLRSAADGQWRYTGIGARSEIVVQVRKRASDWQDHHFVGRLTASLNGYSVQQNEFEDTMWEILGAAENGQLGSDPDGAGKADNYLDVLKIHVKDGQQRGRIGSTVSDQSYDFTAADTDRNGETGTFGAVPDPTAPSQTTYWDAIACPNDDITCSSLPTGYSIRVGDLEATESAGTATLDLEGTLYPSAFPLEVLDASGDLVTAWMPPSGFFGGATFEFSSGGAFSDDDAAGQIDLDIFDSSGTLISTATTGTTWSEAAYQRLAGTVSLPVGARFLAPTLRRTGTDTAVVCSRRVVVREGVGAPWVTCDEDTSGGAGEIMVRGPLILNTDFDDGAHWGTDPDETDDASANVSTPSFGNMDVEFSAGFGNILVKQMASSATDIGKDASGDVGIRYYPVTADDVITLVGYCVREDETEPYDSVLRIYVEYFDENKERVGGEFTTTALEWDSGTEQTEHWGGEGSSRRQARFHVGHERLEPDFLTLIDEAQRMSIRYVAFSVDAATNGNATTIGLKYLTGWINAPEIGLNGMLELQDLPSADGDIINARWWADHPTVAKVVYSLENPPTFDEVDVDPDDLPAGTSIGDFITDFFEVYSQDTGQGLTPIPFGARIYCGIVGVTDRKTGDDTEYGRRSSRLLQLWIDNDRQLVTASNQDSLPIAAAPFRRTVHSGSDNSGSPDIDFAYGPRHEITLDANSTPAFHLTQPTEPGIYDTADYDYTGTVWELVVKQDATGGRTFTWPAGNCVFAGGSAPTVSSGASAEDRFRIECIDPDETTPVFLVSAIAQDIS